MSKCDLVVAGMRALTVPLVNRSNSPELGHVGSFLASSEFLTTASVLVIKQYDPTAMWHCMVEEGGSPDMSDVTDTPK